MDEKSVSTIYFYPLFVEFVRELEKGFQLERDYERRAGYEFRYGLSGEKMSSFLFGTIGTFLDPWNMGSLMKKVPQVQIFVLKIQQK